MKDTPLRMCIVCRQMKQKQELVRVVKNKEGEVFIDPTFKANGRGAYVCKDQQCIQKCIKTKMLNKAFKQNISEQSYALLEDTIGK